jgi:hypothetical protein
MGRAGTVHWRKMGVSFGRCSTAPIFPAGAASESGHCPVNSSQPRPRSELLQSPQFFQELLNAGAHGTFDCDLNPRKSTPGVRSRCREGS